jgi:uncharacterized glyoxalase superfamily protein PhnB
MANLSLPEQVELLDQAVEALISGRESAPSPGDTEIGPLLHIAAELRDLPRADFRARLKEELARSASLASESSTAVEPEEATATVNPIRAGFRTVTPYLTVANVHQEIAFIEQVFAGEGQIYGLGSAGGFHSEYRIGDSMLMIGGGGEGSTWKGTPAPAALHIYVEDVDSVYERAVAAGATSLHPPQDQSYGERSAAFRDVGGNEWYPATAKGARYIPEGLQNLMPYLHPRGAAKQIDFLKEAFGAEELYRGESPDGVIHHAQVKIGTSIVEMGEAHDQWQPMPGYFFLSVDDVDAWYERAMRAAGAISLGEPANQPHGDRVATVKDPFANTWYLASHISDGPVQQSKSEATKSLSETERSTSMAAMPKIFRVVLEVNDLPGAVAFYSKLLAVEGKLQRGSRAYFTCGSVILAVLNPAAGGFEPKTNAGDLYFAVGNIEEIHARARELNCLSHEGVHGASGAEIITRPWGERSFYVTDPWGNGLCFVDETTLFTGE